MILTPENYPNFYQDLYSAPLLINQQSQFFVVRHDSLLLENVSEDEMNNYIDSGELEEVEEYWEVSNSTNSN